jgi:type II secretory pathway pseudopilin PulG
MLIVLVLIAILAGGAVVSLAGRKDSYALCVSSRDLAAAIRLAIGTAQRNQTTARITFDDSLRKYYVEKLADTNTTEFTPVRGKIGLARSLMEGVSIEGVLVDGNDSAFTANLLEFGCNRDSFSGQIKLVNRAGKHTTIEVLPRTGQVHVLE